VPPLLWALPVIPGEEHWSFARLRPRAENSGLGRADMATAMAGRFARAVGAQWDGWLQRSRLNPTGFLRCRHPTIAPALAERFDRTLEDTPPGARIDLALAVEKWVFLHHLIGRGHVLHGSNEMEIEEFETRPNLDAHGNPTEAVFASDDAIWPIYFAVVRRHGLDHGYINWCVHVRNESRYLFSVGRDPRDESAWTVGTIYILPATTFTQTRGSRELTSLVPVRPRARLTVGPDDFPFRSRTMRHHAGATPSSVWLRAAVRRHR
jgi:hypothetical protein